MAGGPAAGAVHRLGVGRYDIGSGPAAHLRIDDAELASRAATLSIAMDGTCDVILHGIARKDDGNEDKNKEKGKGGDSGRPRLDGEGFGGGSWPLGSQLALGNTLLEIDAYSPPNAALKWSEDGAGLDYNRPPRLRPAERKTQFRLPSRPGSTKSVRCPG
ncbi:Cell division protein FtsK OS=Streptomyces tendae OX=1932 GN=GUR47_18100 PE=4 SV=1 [Streptomyces tendae]